MPKPKAKPSKASMRGGSPLDEAILSLSPEAYLAFAALLDAPPKANERLRKTMQTRLIWELPDPPSSTEPAFDKSTLIE